MGNYEDIKKISDSIDDMMRRYLSILRPMQEIARESGVEFNLLKKHYSTILSYLDAASSMSVCDLAESVGINEKSIGRYIKGMVADGLIERRVDSDDLRVGRVTITEKGKDIIRKQEDFAFGYMGKRFLGALSQEEQDELIECCGRLEELFSTVLEYGKALD